MVVARCRCRTACRAGVSPNKIAATNPMPMAKTTTRQSGVAIKPRRNVGQHQQAPQDNIAQCQTRHRSEKSEQKAFSKQLANQPAASGPHGDANSDLPFPGHASRQQQATQIAAGNGKNQQAKGARQGENRIHVVRGLPFPSRGGYQSSSFLRSRPARREGLVFPNVVGMLPAQFRRQRPQFFLGHLRESARAATGPTSARRCYPRRSLSSRWLPIDEVRLLSDRRP